MSNKNVVKEKMSPDSEEPFHIIWGSLSGLNDGSRQDTGELQGTTITTSTWSVPSGITRMSDHKNAVVIEGISYGANTVATIWLEGGEGGEIYELVNEVVLSDGRKLVQSLFIKVKE